MLNGKKIVITGGSRGIGKAIARKFAQNGASIAIIATRESDEAKETVKELKEMGSDARLYTCDIKDPDQVESVSEEILTDFGSVDVLVNNAGVTRDNLLPNLSIMDIDNVIDTNLKGTMCVTRSFIRSFMRQKHGNIINMSSVVGLMGNRGQTNYAASKAGLVGFTKSVAKEYGRRNIRCNAIAPGYIETDMTAKLTDEKRQEIIKMLPLSRLGSTEDVAELALFLADDRSSYITGEVIKVDGGMYV